LRVLAGRIHALGPRPLYELLCELSGSSVALDRFEEYAKLNADFIRSLGGDVLPPPIRVIK
jgi:hypothetical protein